MSCFGNIHAFSFFVVTEMDDMALPHYISVTLLLLLVSYCVWIISLTRCARVCTMTLTMLIQGWVSHVAYVEHGQLKHFTVEDMTVGDTANGKLLDRVETWLTAEKEERKKTDGKVKMRKVEGSQKITATISSKHMSYFR